MMTSLHISTATVRRNLELSSTVDTPVLNAVANLFLSPTRSALSQQSALFSPIKYIPKSDSVESIDTICSEDDDDYELSPKSPSSDTEESSKPHCWICWESEESITNKLIRVCRDCRDCDLQRVHEDCINRYVCNLPLPTLSEMKSFNSKLCSHIKSSQDYNPENLIDCNRTEYYKSNKLDLKLGKDISKHDSAVLNFYYPHLNKSNSSLSRSDSESTLFNEEDADLNEDNIKLMEEIDVEDKLIPDILKNKMSITYDDWNSSVFLPGFSCSRCTNPYVVVSKAKTPFSCLFDDKFLTACITFMSISIWMLTVCCFYLAFECPDFSAIKIDLYLFKLSAPVATFLIDAVCHVIYFWTWVLVWKHCAFKREVVVMGLNESKFKSENNKIKAY